jgi:putative ABC transport system ATP-binding protein
VALARALANNPKIVLADEPTGNLDTANGRHIMDLLRTIHAGRGTTLVLVTHDAELAAMADARLVLRDGRVVESTLPVRPAVSAARQVAQMADARVRSHEAS